MILCIIAFIFYGPIASRVVRSKVLPKVAQKLGRQIAVGNIDVRRGQVRLYDVTVSGENDGERPLARIGEIAVEFDFWKSLRGDVNLGQVLIMAPNIVVVRGGEEQDNISDLLQRLRKRGTKTEGDKQGTPKNRIQLDKIKLVRGRVEVHDADKGVTAIGHDVDAHITAERNAVINMGEAAAFSSFGSHVKISEAEVTFALNKPFQTVAISFAQGESLLWEGMSLTGIKGTLAQSSVPGTLLVDLQGSYGGSTERLWSVKGDIAPKTRTGNLELVAERFAFDRLSNVLEENPYIRDFEQTTLDANARLEVKPDSVMFNGKIGIHGLNVEHPMLASQPVSNIEGQASIDADYDSNNRLLVVRSAELSSGNAKLQLSGELALAGGIDPATGIAREFQRLSVQSVVPRVSCQEVLDAIPDGMAPEIAKFKVKGYFDSNVGVDVDWADLEATRVTGSVGIDGCEVTSAPRKLSSKRLEGSFRHRALIGEDKYRAIRIGPENPDFVSMEDISPYLPLAFITREDATFYSHSGFINREFKTAIVKNLTAGRFAYGASSITMQTVKNVFLTREKTIARKLQELFLTWYIETQLEKDRIMEIYVNAIEYGPGLYGLGPAADVYFDRHPRDLTPMEAVFLATLLPSPRTYYSQFCKDRLLRSIDRKIWKTLELMLSRELIEEDQFFLARTLPLEFSQNKDRLCKKDGYRPGR